MKKRRERWAWIAGQEGRYEVSTRGRVRSHVRKTPRIIGAWTGAADFKYWSVSIGGRPVLAHVLVLETFIGPRPPGSHACHGARGRKDNSIENLYWAVPKQNIGEDRIRDGTSRRAESHWNSKLSDAQVREIRRRCETVGRTEIARVYGVSPNCISRIVNGTRRGYSLTGKEKPKKVRLSHDEVRAMREERRRLGTSCNKLAKKYGISQAAAWNICTGKSYKEI